MKYGAPGSVPNEASPPSPLNHSKPVDHTDIGIDSALWNENYSPYENKSNNMDTNEGHFSEDEGERHVEH